MTARHLMNAVAVSVVLGACGSGCSSPTEPSRVTVQGDWGGASRTQGTYRQTTCAATGTFAEISPSLGWCQPLFFVNDGRIGLSLHQSGNAISGNVFFIDGPRAVTGTAQGAAVTFSGSWSQYPGDPNPVAAAYIRTITWNGSVSGQVMTGEFTVRDSFREGSGYSGALTLGYQLTSLTRE